MKISPGREIGLTTVRHTEGFSGEVLADPVIAPTGGLLVNHVFFGPGARTDWHSHSGGQILYVTSGQGRAYSRDGQGGTIRAGDVVHFQPGEESWHGADPGTYLVHLAVALGEITWHEPITDDEYDRS